MNPALLEKLRTRPPGTVPEELFADFVGSLKISAWVGIAANVWNKQNGQ